LDLTKFYIYLVNQFGQPVWLANKKGLTFSNLKTKQINKNMNHEFKI